MTGPKRPRVSRLSPRRPGDGYRGSVRVLPAKMVPIDAENRAAAVRCLTELLLAGMTAALERTAMSHVVRSLEDPPAEAKETA